MPNVGYNLTGTSGAVNVAPSGNIITWDGTTTAPGITQTSTSGGSGQNLTVQAQSATGGSNNGGNLVLAGGTSGSATSGLVSIASGKLTHQITITSSTYSVDTNSTTSDYVIFTDSTSNAITITLPAPTAGRTLIIKDKTGKASTNNVTVAQHSSETIDGNNFFVLFTNYTSITLISDGSNWSLT